MENLNGHVGILKHDKVGYAEEILLELLEINGFVASIIDPQEAVFGLDTQSYPDALISRCELSSLSDPILLAYVTYFRECVARHIPTINSEKFIMCGQEKYLAHLAVQNEISLRGHPRSINPRTYLAYGYENAYSLALNEIDEGGSVVLKRTGSGRGEGVYFVDNVYDLHAMLTENFCTGEAILIQETIDKERNSSGEYRDIRVWACRKSINGSVEIVGAYYRNGTSGSFLTNVDQGGNITPLAEIDDELMYYSKLVMEATNGDVAGIDFARDVNGRLWFEEINVSFETSKETIEIMGLEIWERVVELVGSAITRFPSSAHPQTESGALAGEYQLEGV